MKLSITMASYNSRDVTFEALDSIFTKTQDLDFEVIVVDNGSVDGSPEMIQKQFPMVRLIKSDSNLGFAAAHNLALSQASGEYLLVLNSDILFFDNTAQRMIAQLQDAPEQFGVIGPAIVNLDRTVAPSSRRQTIYPRYMVLLAIINQYFQLTRYLPMDLLREWLGGMLGKIDDDFSPPTIPQEVEWIDGMCVMFKRKVIEDVGMFDEQFFFDFEIGDLLIRARKAGWKVLFAPNIQIIHLGGYSRNKFSKLMIENRHSQLVYYAKHKPEYFTMVQNAHVIMIGLQQYLLKLQLLFSKEKVQIQENLNLLSDTYKVVKMFDPKLARERKKIPYFSYPYGTSFHR